MRLFGNLSQTQLWIRGALTCLGLIAIAVLTLGASEYWQLRASLPALEGRVAVRELSAPVTVTRDAQGYCQVGVGRFLWQGLGHEHHVQPVPRLPLSR